jgi:putative toxin-antitoxin system antitoxin component (TIGR02293 family)
MQVDKGCAMATTAKSVSKVIRRASTTSKAVAPSTTALMAQEASASWSVRTTPRALVGLRHKYLDLSEVARHQQIHAGIAAADLQTQLDAFSHLRPVDVMKSIGVSTKTLDRKASERLNPRHSDAALALIEVSAQAERILGSASQAEDWLARPALGLDRQRPLDLLTSAPGIQAVKDLLTRIEYGVYA